MKKLRIIGFLLAAVLFFTSASVWEGAAAVVPSGDLPGGGYSAATNSFPKNSIIDITNLENGKTVRVIVVGDLKTSGLLATLSKNAAEVIGLGANSVCRIRMTQPPDNIAFSRYRQGPLPSVNLSADDLGARPDPTAVVPPSTETEATESQFSLGPQEADEPAVVETRPPISIVLPPTMPGILTTSILAAGQVVSESPAERPIPEPPSQPAVAAAPQPDEDTDSQPIVEAAPSPQVLAQAQPTQAQTAQTQQVAQAQTQTQQTQTQQVAQVQTQTQQTQTQQAQDTPPENPVIKLDIAEERIPPATEQIGIAPEDIIGPIDSVTADNEVWHENNRIEAPVIVRESAPADYNLLPEFSPFTAPLISIPEKGMWYVQVGAYSKPELVENEISHIGTAYPIAVQNTGTENDPVFRVLLGPLNQGEGGAMLQRFKSIGYKDAFMRKY